MYEVGKSVASKNLATQYTCNRLLHLKWFEFYVTKRPNNHTGNKHSKYIYYYYIITNQYLSLISVCLSWWSGPLILGSKQWNPSLRLAVNSVIWQYPQFQTAKALGFLHCPINFRKRMWRNGLCSFEFALITEIRAKNCLQSTLLLRQYTACRRREHFWGGHAFAYNGLTFHEVFDNLAPYASECLLTSIHGHGDCSSRQRQLWDQG